MHISCEYSATLSASFALSATLSSSATFSSKPRRESVPASPAAVARQAVALSHRGSSCRCRRRRGWVVGFDQGGGGGHHRRCCGPTARWASPGYMDTLLLSNQAQNIRRGHAAGTSTPTQSGVQT